MGIMIFVGWIIFALGVGKFASLRGHSGGGWFLIALIISPILAIIIVALLPNVAKLQKIEEEHREHANQIQKQRDKEKMQESYSLYIEQKSKVINNRVDVESFSNQLSQVKILHENGILDDSEYSKRKTEIINEIKKYGIVGKPDVFLGNLISIYSNETINKTELDQIKSLLYNEMNKDEKLDMVKRQSNEDIIQNYIKNKEHITLPNRFRHKGYAVDNDGAVFVVKDNVFSSFDDAKEFIDLIEASK